MSGLYIAPKKADKIKSEKLKKVSNLYNFTKCYSSVIFLGFAKENWRKD